MTKMLNKRGAIRLCVARGESPDGRPWSLFWPSWKWEEMTAAEKQATIERQADLLNASILWQID